MMTNPAARFLEIQTLTSPSINKDEEEEIEEDVMILSTENEEVDDEEMRDEDNNSADMTAGPSTNTSANNSADTTEDWRKDIHEYLLKGSVPKNRLEAHKLKSRATNYELRNGVLYRKSFTGPSLRCLSREEGEKILQMLHSGDAGNHSAGRSLAHRAKTQGYYWPYMHEDAKKLSRKCKQCQRHGHRIHAPGAPLTSSKGVWPFGKWGLDIVGPFLPGTGQKRYLIVATDYFTKWTEVKALQHIRDKDIFTFIFENIICRFGIPAQLVSDNGKQFEGENIEMLLNAFNIKCGKSTPLYPQANGQAEATNKTLADILKKKLDRYLKSWCEQISNVVWAYNTTRREATRMSPFCLTYGVEAVLPTEVAIPTEKREAWEKNLSASLILCELDDLEEKREIALQHIENYQRRVAREYNKRVRIRDYAVGDLVLRETPRYQKETGGKLASKWDGPYIIKEITGTGAYRLMDPEGRDVGHRLDKPWNRTYLKKYYQ